MYFDKKIRLGNIARAAFLCVFLFLSSGSAFGEIVAIVHPSNAVTEFSTDELKKIFMNNRKNWPDGTAITVWLPAWGSDEMTALTTRIIKCGNESNLKKYYLTAIFQQKIVEIPTSVRDEQEAVRMVAANAGSIAIVDESKILGSTGIKIVRISGL
ncbi:MAG: substrate-binding domain-containing protein [Candidatus Omnitrophica bacterium]|nr:substrate-binding domain-containing protein [Candidatus Omnitrophota bacterium]